MLDHLEDNIRRVIADIRPQMLEKVIEIWTSRLDYIRASRGMQGFNLKNQKYISYPTIIRSAIHPVPHGPDLPIPSPPDTLDNISDDLDQISHISSDSDDGYDPGTNDPELFSQSDLNEIWASQRTQRKF
ncbi:hypothetical protein TNCV_3275151 [Trichonephila clavipes]|nr:hypothetical protein TNCV_3275151 [Trichonephila clavipes]